MRRNKIISIFNALKGFCQDYKLFFSKLNESNNTIRKNKFRYHPVPIKVTMCLILISICVKSTAQSTNNKLDRLGNHTSRVQKEKSGLDNLKKEVYGTVRDEDGLTFPGVTVLLKGTLVGTTTNNDGYYDFPEKLSAGDTLEFRFLGHNPVEYVIKNKTKKANVNLVRTVLLQSHIIVYGALSNGEVYKRKKRKHR